MQKWKGDEAGVGCQVTGVRRIRVSGVGCSGDGREARGKRQCKSANRSEAPVQRWKSEYKKGTSGKGDRGTRRGERQEAVQRCKRAKVEKWRSGCRVSGDGRRGRQETRDKRQEARGERQEAVEKCKGGNVERWEGRRGLFLFHYLGDDFAAAFAGFIQFLRRSFAFEFFSQIHLIPETLLGCHNPSQPFRLIRI